MTGSRVRRTSDFDTANPTTVVDETCIKSLGLVNVGGVVAQLPANLSSNTPSTAAGASFFAGSTIANLRGLNPFFGRRALVAGQRSPLRADHHQGGGVGLSFIPSVLIGRVGIVTGGTSAAYGSGAIAGVQNIFLNRKLEGGKVEIDYSRAEAGGGDGRHIGVAYGLRLFGRAPLGRGVKFRAPMRWAASTRVTGAAKVSGSSAPSDVPLTVHSELLLSWAFLGANAPAIRTCCSLRGAVFTGTTFLGTR